MPTNIENFFGFIALALIVAAFAWVVISTIARKMEDRRRRAAAAEAESEREAGEREFVRAYERLVSFAKMAETDEALDVAIRPIVEKHNNVGRYALRVRAEKDGQTVLLNALKRLEAVLNPMNLEAVKSKVLAV